MARACTRARVSALSERMPGACAGDSVAGACPAINGSM